MIRALALALIAAVFAAGCGVGEVSADQQKAKSDALKKVAAESPDADKVEQ